MAEKKQTANEMKSLLTSLGVSFPEDADSAALAKLLEEARGRDESEEKPAEAPDSVDKKATPDPGKETETHFIGKDGRKYRKPQPPLGYAPFADALKTLKDNTKAVEEEKARQQMIDLAARLYKAGYSKKWIKAVVTEAFNMEDGE